MTAQLRSPAMYLDTVPDAFPFLLAFLGAYCLSRAVHH